MVAQEQMRGANSGDRSAVLIDEAHPNLYRKNAFRILGLPVDASTRDINRQMQRMRMLAGTGSDSLPRIGDLPSIDNSPDGDVIHSAVQRLRNPELRLADELFWFWPSPSEDSENDNVFPSASNGGDYDRVAGIFRAHERRSNGDPVSAHNLAVLAHALVLDLEHTALTETLTEEQRRQKEVYWKYAYAKWKICLSHEGLWKRLRARARELDDPRITTGLVRRFRATLPILLLSINARLCVSAAEKGDAEEARRHLQLMKNAGLAPAFVDETIRLACTSIQKQIKLQCNSARKQAEQRPEQADKTSRRLIEETDAPLAALKTILRTGHPDRQAACDDVALTVLECQIGFVLRTNNLQASLQLLQRTRSIAETEPARQRIQENIRIVEDNLACKPCWFCEEYLAKGENNLQIKKSGSAAGVFPSSSPSSEGPLTRVEIPRCARCRSVHRQARTLRALGAVIGGLAGIALCTVTFNPSAGPGIQSLHILGVACAIGIGSRIGNALGHALAPAGVRPESAKREYPRVEALVDERGGAVCTSGHVH